MSACSRAIVFTLLLSMGSIEAALADTPVINITAPLGGTVMYVPSFPYPTTISMNIEHPNPATVSGGGTIDSIKDLDVTVDTSSLPNFPVADPNSSSACLQVNSTTWWTTCNVNSASNTAAITVPWEVPAPGTYSIAVSVAHGNNSDDDTEEVEYDVQLVTVEYPAPPAVANAYIKAMYGKLTGGLRGCIISEIAHNHAYDSKYGEKGGPYDDGLIEADVDAYYTDCGGT